MQNLLARLIASVAATLVVAGGATSALAQSQSRIKDIASLQSGRDNQLIGYGLIVGLQGSGDSLRSSPFTEQSMRAMLQNLGISTQGGQSSAKNVAAVMVTTNLPPFASPGSRIDVNVSSLGDASSLRGGTLVMTSLSGADGQIYAMAGMQTKLHLIADRNAEMDGISANYSGAGFTGMKFKAISTTQEDFDAWVSEVKKSPKQLDQAEYAALAKPSQNNPVELYSSVTPNQFQIIVDKYEGMKPGKPLKHEKKEKEVAATDIDAGSHSAAGAEE